MKNFTVRNVFLMMLAICFLSQCKPATMLTSSWSVQDGTKSYKNLAVVAMTKNPANRETVERAVALEFRAQGIKAIGTTGIFPFADKQDELKEMGMEITPELIQQKVKEKVAKNDIDALMIISLLDKDKELEHRGGNFSVGIGAPVAGYPYYGYNYYTYYSYAYTTVYDPGYYVNVTTYMVESNLYDVASENLIWSGTTETTDPESVSKESAAFAKVLVDQIILDKALKP